MSDLASAIGIRVDEQDLVAELKAGSEQAFALLLAQYSHPIYSLIARSISDPADAADVTQDVFVKVFRNISSFHGEASLRTWIYRIALHEASNQRRWWGRHKRQELTIDAQLENDEGETFCMADALAASGLDGLAIEQALLQRVDRRRLIDSAPPAIITSASPTRMRSAAIWIAVMPEKPRVAYKVEYKAIH